MLSNPLPFLIINRSYLSLSVSIFTRRDLHHESQFRQTVRFLSYRFAAYKKGFRNNSEAANVTSSHRRLAKIPGKRRSLGHVSLISRTHYYFQDFSGKLQKKKKREREKIYRQISHGDNCLTAPIRYYLRGNTQQNNHGKIIPPAPLLQTALVSDALLNCHM